MGPDDPRHGTTRGYHQGCRDACCRAAIARYEKAGRLAKLSGGRAVPAIGAQRRLQALMRLGWGSTQIAEAAGLPHRNHVLRVLNGQKGKPTTWIEKATDQWVRDVYEALSMRLPDSTPSASRTRARAERAGWPPPLAWDDIDDPNERPHTTTPTAASGRPETLPALIEDFDWLVSQGESEHAAAARIGVRLDNFRDSRRRHERAS